ncbi:MAG: hypothetical protein C5B57_08930 [Blastocatellia bacterium]|nr:MAG: hypothetical protein C5B57_08930 [Blastocatellia bacterium]
MWSIKCRSALTVVTIAVSVTISASPARAQAWLPAQGEGTVSFLFQDTYMKYHYFATTPYDRGHIEGDTLLVDVTYGVTDKLAVSVGIPWVASKYNGPFPHPLAQDVLAGLSPVRPNPIDDGTYHSTFQDLRFDVRYNVTRKGIVLTPFVGSIVPSHDYTYFAHSAAGRDLNELQAGVLGAKLLDSLVPGLFVQGNYSYGFTEQVLDVSHNRSVMGLELGYFVTPKLRVLALTNGQVTHGGIDFVAPPCQLCPAPRPSLPNVDSAVVFTHHDQIDRVNFLNVGGGAAYALSENLDVFGSVIHAVAQRNGHGIDRGLSIGLSWSFLTPQARNRALASADRSLAKCLCEKKAG